MRVISVRTLREFWEKNASARDALSSWNSIMKRSVFTHPNEIKQVFNHADFLGDGIAIFNIKGNDFRLIVHIIYRWQVVYILWVGSHAAYDKLSEEAIHKMKQPKKKKDGS